MKILFKIGLMFLALMFVIVGIEALLFPRSSDTATPSNTETLQSSNIQEPKPSQTIIPLPDYKVISQSDISFGKVIRIEVNAVASKDLSKSELQRISEDIIEEITSQQEINAIAISFWEHEDAMGAKPAFATVNWAPYGDWSKAMDIQTGDYSTHEFTVKILRIESEDENDTDYDGIPDSIDPLPLKYGTVSEAEYVKRVNEIEPKLVNVLGNLTELMNDYNGGKISKEEFKSGLEKQDEILWELSDRLDVIPPIKFDEFNNHYFPAIVGYQNTVYWLTIFADSNSQSDFNLAMQSEKTAFQELQLANSLYPG